MIKDYPVLSVARPSMGRELEIPHVGNTFIVTIAVWTVEFVDSDADVGPLVAAAQWGVTHTAPEALHVIVQTQGLNYHSSAKTWNISRYRNSRPTNSHCSKFQFTLMPL